MDHGTVEANMVRRLHEAARMKQGEDEWLFDEPLATELRHQRGQLLAARAELALGPADAADAAQRAVMSSAARR